TLLTVMLRKKIGRMDGMRIFNSLRKIVPASAAMGMIGWIIGRQPVWALSGSILLKAALLFGGVVSCVLFYVVVMWILQSEELQFMWGMVKRKTRPTGQGHED